MNTYFKIILYAFLIGFSYSAEPIDMESLAKMIKISDYQSNNDGTYIVYTATAWDKDLDKNYSYITALKVSTKEKYALTNPGADKSNSCSSPSFLYDQKANVEYVLYNCLGQIFYSVFLDQIVSFKLTNYPVSIGSYKVVEGMLVFTAEVYPEFVNDLNLTAQKIAADAEKGENSFYVYDSLMVRHWNVWYYGRLNQIFSQKIAFDTKKIVLVDTPINRFNGKMSYIPLPPLGGSDMFDLRKDGAQLIFSALDKDSNEAYNTNWITYTSDLNDDNSHPKVFSFNQKARTTSPKYSPSGKTVLFLAMEQPFIESGNLNFRHFDLSTSTIIKEFGIDRNIESFDFFDENTILFSALDKGIYKIGTINLGFPSKKVNFLEQSDNLSSYGGFVRLNKRYKVIVQRSAIDQIPQLYAFNFNSNPSFNDLSFEVITNENKTDIIAKRLSTSDYLLIKKDDEEIQAILIKPFQYDETKKYPLVLNIHGGPEAAWANQFSFSFVSSQIIAARGKAVLLVNPHGSVGMGQKFTDAVRYDWGGKPLDDLIYVVNHLQGNSNYSYIDFDHKCAMGGSYGGYMVNWMRGRVKETNTVFNCYITDDGVFSTRSTSYNTEELWFNLAEYCPPNSDPKECRPYIDKYKEGFDKFSPETLIANWNNAPHLVIHGQNDFRLTWSEGNALFTALQLRGIKSKYLFFYEEGHSVVRQKNRIFWAETINDFLDENINFKVDINYSDRFKKSAAK